MLQKRVYFALFKRDGEHAFFVANFQERGIFMNTSCYQLLADAIVIQAAKDFRRAKSEQTRDEIREFFMSHKCFDLTGMDGRKILCKLEQERKEKHKNDL